MDQNHDNDINSGITIRTAKQIHCEGLEFA